MAETIKFIILKLKEIKNMPYLSTYNIFISHSWNYSDAYNKLENILNNAPNFKWKNYSVPKDDPIHDAPNQDKLYEAIKNQIKYVNCVLILAGVYSSYSKWIDKEIKIAKELKKPIVAIEPWGSERTSQKVKENADVIVKWNSKSMIDAIRKYSI